VAIELIATPSAASANSYISVADADAYVDQFLLVELSRETWLDLDQDDKARLLIQATRQLDWYFEWLGYPTINNQPLAWPRQAVWRTEYELIDSNSIPKEVEHATVEMALWLSSVNDDIPTVSNNQFSEIAVGPIRVNFNENAGFPSKNYYPEKVISILRVLGTPKNPDVPGSNQVKSVSLVRS
jgi:hypothetical protein